MLKEALVVQHELQQETFTMPFVVTEEELIVKLKMRPSPAAKVKASYFSLGKIMDYIELAFFTIFSLGVCWVFHLRIRNFFVSAIVSSVVISITLQVISYFDNGYIDPFIPISFSVTLLISIFISAIVGFIVRKRKI
jgi:hypothetical protein